MQISRFKLWYKNYSNKCLVGSESTVNTVFVNIKELKEYKMFLNLLWKNKAY